MIKRLGIIGDLHGEDQRLENALEWLHGERLDALICTGDVADGRGCINRSCDLLAAAGVETVAGNHDRWLLEDRVRHLDDAHLQADLSDSSREFLASLPRQRQLQTINGALLLCHGVADNDLAKVWPGTARSAVRRSDELDRLIAEDDYRFLINGHMHFRVLIDFPQLLMINAGTLKGEFGGITVIDFELAQISAYEVGDASCPSMVCEQPLACDSRRVWADTQAFDGDWQPATLYA
jgi:predicted phosphodiesterase